MKLDDIAFWHCPHSMRSGVYITVLSPYVRQSVRSSVCPNTGHSRFAVECPACRRYHGRRSAAVACGGQHHVVSVRRKLNTDLLGRLLCDPYLLLLFSAVYRLTTVDSVVRTRISRGRATRRSVRRHGRRDGRERVPLRTAAHQPRSHVASRHENSLRHSTSTRPEQLHRRQER